MEILRKVLLGLLKIVHLVILLFVVFGWLLPRNWLLIHLIFVPLMVLQWQFNQGSCILTNWENAIRGNTKIKTQQQGQFIKGILGKFCQPLPSDAVIKRWVYGVIALSWILSAIHWRGYTFLS